MLFLASHLSFKSEPCNICHHIGKEVRENSYANDKDLLLKQCNKSKNEKMCIEMTNTLYPIMKESKKDTKAICQPFCNVKNLQARRFPSPQLNDGWQCSLCQVSVVAAFDKGNEQFYSLMSELCTKNMPAIDSCDFLTEDVTDEFYENFKNKLDAKAFCVAFSRC